MRHRDRICDNCKFAERDYIITAWELMGPEQRWYFCHRRSPSVNFHPSFGNLGISGFPRITGDQWCGEWDR
jgi:hypothetical protein